MEKNRQILMRCIKRSVALFALLLASTVMLWADETIALNGQGYKDGAEVTSVSGTDCTVTFDKGSGSNPPKYYTTGTAVRMYGGNTMTVASATKTIVGIVITFGSGDGSNTITTNVATYNSGTWTGSASSVTFTVGGSSGNRRIQALTVAYTGDTPGPGPGPGDQTDPADPTDPHAAVLAYYQNANGKKGAALKTAMSGIIYSRTEQSYNSLWTAFKTTDVRSDGKIWDMYSNTTSYVPGGPAQGANYKKEGDSYNREHSFPQSWFNSNIPMHTDLFHVYPTDGFVNNKRQNYPFGETKGEEYKSNNGFSKLGTCTYTGYSGTVFEPNDEYKGDFARTYFYMVTCYEEQLNGWYKNCPESRATIDGSTYPGLTLWQLEMLMNWAKNDPVSEKETKRNNAVYSIQENRNPFIDYPGLEEYIWGDKKNTAFSYDHYVRPDYNKQDVTMSFSLPAATATLGEDFTEPTLTTTPAGLTVSYSSSNEAVATVNANTGDVTLVAEGTTEITATFAGNSSYNPGTASYLLAVSAAATPGGETVLYEGLTGYSAAADGTAELEKDNSKFDYKNWSSLSKIYSGGTDNANSNGGCLKFGSSSAVGSMTTGNISLTGSGTLTFYLKKYKTDTGNLKVTVTGATADASQFTPASQWALCTVHLINATGTVTVKFETTSKRAYVDEIKLISGGGTAPAIVKGDANGDGHVNIADVTAIINHINLSTPQNFNEQAADANNDGVINIADVTAVINIINE